MILFLMPGDCGYQNYTSLAMYHEHSPFEKNTRPYDIAMEILSSGNELHVAHFTNDEEMYAHIKAFDKTAMNYVRHYAKMGGYTFGPAYILTKGIHVDKLQQIIDHLIENNMASVLYLNPIIGLDFTVNPYGANKLE